jgi:hypothetical protein
VGSKLQLLLDRCTLGTNYVMWNHTGTHGKNMKFRCCLCTLEACELASSHYKHDFITVTWAKLRLWRNVMSWTSC